MPDDKNEDSTPHAHQHSKRVMGFDRKAYAQSHGDLILKNLDRANISEEQIQAEIEVSKSKIREHLDNIANTFVRLKLAESPANVKLTIGPELECTEIAGHQAYMKRSFQILQQIENAVRDGNFPTHDINDKKGLYMPEKAHVPRLDAEYFAPVEKLGPHVTRVRVEAEPTFRSNLFEVAHKDHNGVPTAAHVAASQIEFSGPPMPALGVAEWLNRMMDIVVHSAKSLDLNWIDMRSEPNDSTSPNSIHLNSVISIDGKNAFSKAQQENNAEFYGQPSELLLCIGKAHIDYLKHSMFLFARAENDYNRYAAEAVSGPSYLGMNPRKEQGNYGTAMFRGEGRKSERLNSADPDKEDKGDMRFEFRLPGMGAAGHPNKTGYPEQRILPYQMIEAYLDMLEKGVKLWEERTENRKHDQQVAEITEETLRTDTVRNNNDENTATLPEAREDAIQRFMASKYAKSYWGDRIPMMLQLANRIDEINRKDTHPSASEKGPHVVRLLSRYTPENHEPGIGN